MKFKQDPSCLLKSFGIYTPQDINLDLVAWALGASVKRNPMRDCEGYILGTSERAVITINSDASPERQRFSLGHELGHWVNDRHSNLTYRCTNSDMNQFSSRPNNLRQQKEVRANKYSAELIFPRHIADPLIKNRDLTFDSVGDIATLFSASITSSAIRLLERSGFPGMLICWDKNGKRKWFIRNDCLSGDIWPHQHVSAISLGRSHTKAKQVDMDLWIDHQNAIDHVITQSMFYTGYDCLTLLWWHDESFLVI